MVECPPLVKTGDMHNLEFPNHTFDLIYTNALDHSFNLHKAIEECYRVLKPKGILIVDIKYKDKGRYEVIRFDDEITFKKMFSRHFKLVKEENINNRGMPAEKPRKSMVMTCGRKNDRILLSQLLLTWSCIVLSLMSSLQTQKINIFF